jgi:tyrosyl-tRNA synthetase
MKSDVEIGGQDQRFNLLVGRDLQKHFGQPQQALIFLPLLEGTDGHDKMSKSLGNAIGINEPSKDMFGKLMSIPDALMPRYYEILTRIEKSEVEKLLGAHPRDAKLKLAEDVVAQFHGAEIARQEVEKFISQFSKQEIPSDAPTLSLKQLPKDVPLFKLLSQDLNLFSAAEGKRLCASGGIKVQNEKVDMDFTTSRLREGDVIKVGKLKFFRVTQ